MSIKRVIGHSAKYIRFTEVIIMPRKREKIKWNFVCQARDRFTGELYEVTEKPVPPRKKYDYIRPYLKPFGMEIREIKPEPAV